MNDAPALKQADCGIAVSGATDAARAAASIVLLAPGLSVIIDAIKEARRIFQRMNSYAIYRIAETLRVLLFMVLAILVFNFYPVTAVMIVMIAVLNDGAILSIAYDNVHSRRSRKLGTCAWYWGSPRYWALSAPSPRSDCFTWVTASFTWDPEMQTMMYLLLSVAGHLTIFLTRTRGPFWSIRPAKILWIAVLGTQTVATLIAVYGLFMPPLGWKLAGLVWGYALVWAVVTDRVKLLGYHFLDHAKAEPKFEARGVQLKLDAKANAPKPELKADAKLGAKADEPTSAVMSEQQNSGVTAGPTQDVKADAPKPEIKAEAKPNAKAEATPYGNAERQSDATPKILSDLNAQIATRAYELYKQRSDKESQAIGDWEQAERDIREDDANTTPKAQTKIGPETNTSKLEAGAEVKAGSDSDTKPADTAPAVNDESKPETKDKIPSDVTPQLVKRVHALYEELGREEIQAVQEWEKSEPETLKK